MEHCKFSKKADFTALVESTPLIVVEFSATWCGPCKQLAPLMNDLAKEMSSQGVKFISVDVDDNTEVAEALNIQAMPTVRVYKNNQELHNIVGANFEKIKEAVKLSLSK